MRSGPLPSASAHLRSPGPLRSRRETPWGKSRAVALAIGCALTLAAAPAPAGASSGNPPNGKTGAPGEGTCRDCHASFPLNGGDGLFTIAAPAAFAPGHTYTITVSLEDPGQSRWGFELTPLDVGACTITDPQHTQVSVEGGRTYVKQTSAGTFDGTTGPVSWSFDWTAPVEPVAEVVFYAAGNASNSNGLTSGDYIYTTSFASLLDPAGIDDPRPVDTGLALAIAPNPVRDRALVRFALVVPGMISLEVFDLRGARVARLAGGYAGGGERHVHWDATDDAGRPLPGGVYLCRLLCGDQRTTRPLILVR